MSTGNSERQTPSLGKIRRKAVDVGKLIETSTIGGNEMPLVVTPAVDGVDLADWAANNRDELDGYFDRHGAILFRGFDLKSAEDFEGVASGIVPDLFAEYGDLPPEGTSERIYHSTPYPGGQDDPVPQRELAPAEVAAAPVLLLHPARARRRARPRCSTTARVVEELDPEIVREFEEKGLLYVRNFSPGIDVSWQDFFKTEDRAEVERTCGDEGMACEWKDGDSLRISQRGPGVDAPPANGREDLVQPGSAASRLLPRPGHAGLAPAAVRRGGHAAQRLLRRRQRDSRRDGRPHQRGVRAAVRRAPVGEVRPDRPRQHVRRSTHGDRSAASGRSSLRWARWFAPPIWRRPASLHDGGRATDDAALGANAASRARFEARCSSRQEQRESNARTYPRRLPIAIKRASGSYIEDLDGNVFIDFLTGAGVLALGHNHPEVVEAVHRQLDVFCHGLDFPTEVKDEFVSTQLALLPESMRDRMKIQFCGPAGANAVDAALKLCKTATGRGDIVAFQGAFHGSSHSAMAVTGSVSQKEPIANGMPGVHFFPYPYAYRWPVTLDPETCGAQCLHTLESALKDPLGGIAKPAAVIIEIVQAEGGVIVGPVDFIRGVRELDARARHSADRRRDPDRLRPDGHLVRVRAVRNRAGRHHRVEGARRDRHADRGRVLQRGARHLGPWRPHCDLPRKPARVRSGYRLCQDHPARRHPRARAARERVRPQRAQSLQADHRAIGDVRGSRPDGRYGDDRPRDRRAGARARAADPALGPRAWIDPGARRPIRRGRPDAAAAQRVADTLDQALDILRENAGTSRSPRP